MLNQRDLLKEAIADAKAVKETAIANAKSVLEETFTPHLKSMLSAKLEEMEHEDEIDENQEIEEQDIDMEEMNLDELLAELDEENLDSSQSKGGLLSRIKNLKDYGLEGDSIEFKNLLITATTQEDEEETPHYFVYGEDDESEDGIFNSTNPEEVAEFVSNYPQGELNENEGESEESEESEEEGGDVEEEEIDLENMAEEELIQYIESVISDMVEAGELEPGDSFEEETSSEDDDMEIDIEDIEDDESVMEEYDTVDSEENMRETVEDDEEEVTQKIQSGIYQEELKELRSELNEVNLLNAKLLYANKIYTSKNLSESKKLNVLKAFDKAETVKEAKIVYESLNQSLDVRSKPKSNIREIKSMASKSSGVSNKKQPIVENQTFKRFQELAGII